MPRYLNIDVALGPKKPGYSRPSDGCADILHYALNGDQQAGKKQRIATQLKRITKSAYLSNEVKRYIQ
jgi:hypothetical protein